jgi:hypothetical protein
LVVCAVLAVLTPLASDAPSVVIAGFWVGLAVLFTVWTGLPERRAWRARASTIDDALKVNRARVTRIASDRVVEIQEVEDEGACFAFDAGSGRTIVVARQECYSDETFANSDFSILEVLGWAGAVDVIVTRAGHKVEPERRWISRSTSRSSTSRSTRSVCERLAATRFAVRAPAPGSCQPPRSIVPSRCGIVRPSGIQLTPAAPHAFVLLLICRSQPSGSVTW